MFLKKGNKEIKMAAVWIITRYDIMEGERIADSADPPGVAIEKQKKARQICLPFHEIY